MQSIYSEGWGSYSASKFYDFSLRNSYMNDAVVIISGAFKNGKIIERDAKGEIIQEGGLITKLLSEPNYNQSTEEFFNDFIRNLFSGGFAYLLPFHDNPAYSNFIDKDSEIRCLNVDNIDFGGRKITMFQKEMSFDYILNSEKQVFNYSQIIPFFDIAQDPSNHFKGVSRLRSLEEEVNQIWLANKAIDNQIKLSGNIIVSPDAHKESEMSLGLERPLSINGNSQKTHKDVIEDKLNIPGIIFGKSLTVSSTALKAINLAESLKDYDYNSKFKQEAGRVMLNLYQIPRKLQNIVTTSELKSDKEGEDVDLYEKIVIPVANSLADSLNSVYGPLTKSKIEIDFSHLSVFAERKENAKKTEREAKKETVDLVVKLIDNALLDKASAIKILKDEKIID